MKLWSMLAPMAAFVLVVVAPEANGGGVTPITTCGQVVTTNAVLTQDLICTGDGVVVGASGITIDLKGFTVRGDRGSGEYGINGSAGQDDVTIKNGVVRNYDYGILEERLHRRAGRRTRGTGQVDGRHRERPYRDRGRRRRASDLIDRLR